MHDMGYSKAKAATPYLLARELHVLEGGPRLHRLIELVERNLVVFICVHVLEGLFADAIISLRKTQKAACNGSASTT